MGGSRVKPGGGTRRSSHAYGVLSDKKPKVKYLRPDEANRLIAAAGQRGRHGFRDKLPLRMTYRHGLRATEAVDMRWEQIDLDRGTINVQRLKRGKDSTHSMDRDELRDLRGLRKASTGPYVFESERGGPTGRDMLAYIVREAGKAAGLGDCLHPHMLRHAADYSMVDKSVDLWLIQDFLGHCSAQMTMLLSIGVESWLIRNFGAGHRNGERPIAHSMNTVEFMWSRAQASSAPRACRPRRRSGAAHP